MTKERRRRGCFGTLDQDRFIRRSWVTRLGFPDHAFDGQPFVGICNTWSELTACTSGVRDLAEGVKADDRPVPSMPVKRSACDIARMSDARTSRTAFGTDIPHVASEATTGGPMTLVKTEDRIGISGNAGVLDLLVSETELAERCAMWVVPETHCTHGCARIYVKHVLQPDEGAALCLLVGKDTRPMTRESH